MKRAILCRCGGLTRGYTMRPTNANLVTSLRQRILTLGQTGLANAGNAGARARRLGRREIRRNTRSLHRNVQPVIAAASNAPDWFTQMCNVACLLWRAEQIIKARSL